MYVVVIVRWVMEILNHGQEVWGLQKNKVPPKVVYQPKNLVCKTLFLD